MTENHRRLLNLITCCASWAGAVGIAVWVVFFHDAVAQHSSRWPGLAVIILVGIAITASFIRSRYKLADTITEVFRAGVRVGQATEALRKTPEED